MGEMDAYEVEYQIMEFQGEEKKLPQEIRDMHNNYHPNKYDPQDLKNAGDAMKRYAGASAAGGIYNDEGWMSLKVVLSNNNWVTNNGPYPDDVNSTRYYQDLAKSSSSTVPPFP
jgi:hypothetical protein